MQKLILKNFFEYFSLDVQNLITEYVITAAHQFPGQLHSKVEIILRKSYGS